MSRLDLASLREGDVIEATMTLQVTRVGSGDYVETQDVQSGGTYGFLPGDVDGSRCSRKLTMVKRAVRKPKVGDVLTGDEIVARKWTPGTVLQSVRNPGDLYVMGDDNRWTASGDVTTSSIRHEAMYGTWTAKVRYVA